MPSSLNTAVETTNFLLTSGMLRCSVCWSRDDNGKVLCPPLLSKPTHGLGCVTMQCGVSQNCLCSWFDDRGAHQNDAIATLGAAGMVDIRKLASWIGIILCGLV